MKNKTFFLSLILILILCSVVISAENFPPGQSLGDLTIFYPKLYFYPQGEASELNIYSFNSGNIRLPNTDYDCSFHIYNSKGEHVMIINSMENHSNGVDKYINLNSSVYNDLGIKYYNVECESAVDSGAVSESFYITRNGEEYHSENIAETNTFLVISFLGLAIIFLIISYLFKGEEKAVKHLRGLFFYLSISHLLIISLIIGTATNCDSGLCGDINKFSGVGEAYVFIIGALIMYVMYTYGIARVTSVTENKK